MIWFLSKAVILATLVMLAHVARVDFLTLKVRNRAILILLGLYALWAALTGFDTLPGDAGAAALLSVIALAMWLVGAMGAGDVKLYAVLGLFIGLSHLGLFVILLLLMSVAFLIALRNSGKSTRGGQLNSRLREFNSTGKAPYAVLMCAAAIPAIGARAFL